MAGCVNRAATLLIAALLAQSAAALIVSDPSTTALINSSAPADDPGWHNSLTGGFSGVYLGNQWVLTANHAVNKTSPPATINLPGGTYPLIPNTFVTLSNPTSFGGTEITTPSDLLMFRIGAEVSSGLKPEQHNPATRAISVATTQPAVGTELLMIGSGYSRNLNGFDTANYEFHWQPGFVDVSDNPALYDSAAYHGYYRNNVTGTNVWGRNRVSDDEIITGDEGDPNGHNILVQFGENGPMLITLATQFDRARDNQGNPIPGSTAVPYEAQGANGDSGGPVFYKDAGGNWKLVGIMASIFVDEDQNARAPVQLVYGNITVFSDLSTPHYRAQIENLLPSTQYSIPGDINLDGVVSGSVINGAPTGDLAAFVAGWNHRQAVADINSWRRGDLNGDGQTNFADFALLRAELGTTVVTPELSQLLAAYNSNVVPEPSAVLIAFGMGAALLLRWNKAS